MLRDKHGLAPKTINNIRSVFIIMMKEAVTNGLIERNPVEMTISRTVDKKKQELLTDEECAKLFDIERIKYLWNDRIVYYVYSLVAGLTGLRAGELLALTINEVYPNKIDVKRSYNEDGAKPSCAGKIVVCVNAALIAHSMAMEDKSFIPGDGIVKDDVDKTVKGVGRIASIGMKETDDVILDVMLE